ncbi:MAG TPA: ABC transporter substrate-binding protein [Bacilli bacterium]
MKKAGYLLLALVLIFVVAGCGNKSDQGAQSTTAPQSTASGDTQNTPAPAEENATINLYTSESQDLVNEMVNDFKAANPGIDVNIFRSGTGPVISKIQAEMGAGGIQADVIWFADIDFFGQLAEKGLLEAYNSPEAKDLDPRYVYDGGKYYEVRQIFNVIGYNTNKVKTAPKSWKDLADPSLKGKVAIADPNYSGAAFFTLATFVNDQNLGWDYFKSLKANNTKFEQSNGNLTSKVSSGEYSAVSVVDFMVRNAKNSGSPVDTVWPSEGAVLIPTPVGIISSSQHKEAAKKLIDYFLSEAGQKFFVKQGYIPVKDGVGVPEGAPNLKDIKIYPLATEFMSKNRDNLKKTFGEIFETK